MVLDPICPPQAGNEADGPYYKPFRECKTPYVASSTTMTRSHEAVCIDKYQAAWQYSTLGLINIIMDIENKADAVPHLEKLDMGELIKLINAALDVVKDKLSGSPLAKMEQDAGEVCAVLATGLAQINALMSSTAQEISKRAIHEIGEMMKLVICAYFGNMPSCPKCLVTTAGIDIELRAIRCRIRYASDEKNAEVDAEIQRGSDEKARIAFANLLTKLHELWGQKPVQDENWLVILPQGNEDFPPTFDCMITLPVEMSGSDCLVKFEKAVRSLEERSVQGL